MKNVLWDFDGVILDSMKVRDFGFREIFKSFKKDKIEKLIDYHRENGGLSRYVKIRYFFENLLNQEISEERVNEYASMFSDIMRVKLIEKKNLITDSVDFIRNNYKKYNFHIVSGSDQNELRFLCDQLELSQYFLTIEGSPTPKKKLVNDILEKKSYSKKETCLIGDSINDKDAAEENNILFIGYNNLDFKEEHYITSFSNNNIL